MSSPHPGRVLAGTTEQAQRLLATLQDMQVDQDGYTLPPAPIRKKRTTLSKSVRVQGPGTFSGHQTRTIEFHPSQQRGWWFDRVDLPESLPIEVNIHNVWTTGQMVSNIVLRSGAPNNYVRLVEHIIALRMGMDVDDVMIKIDSGDPPLFNVGSMPLLEAIENVDIVETDRPLRYVTVKEPVCIATETGKLLVFEPADPANPALDIDCGIDFPNAIGAQRICFPVNRAWFRHGAHARTNTDARKKLYCQTIGKLFADVRNLGYTKENVLVAGKSAYVNEAQLLHKGRSLEAVWHRAVLDLLAAVALIERGAFLGKISSYKAGHGLDVEAVNLLYRHDLLEVMEPNA